MIQFRIEVVEYKPGKVSVEARLAVCKKTATVLEHQATAKLKDIVKGMLAELAGNLPGSALAVTEEDVETLRGIEKLEIEEDMDDKI